MKGSFIYPRALRLWTVYLIFPLVALSANIAFSQNYAIVVGHNVGHFADDPLQFAERDAERFWELITTLGDVNEQDSFLLLAPTKSQVDQAFDRIKATLSSGVRLDHTATVIFYYAGHGDQENLHLGNENLRRDELIRRLKSLDARVKLVILDACQTPLITRTRGVRAGASYAVTVSNDTPPKGVVIIDSSQAGEPALESDTLGGSLFSHFWLSALRGAADSDRDGVVTLQEAYLFTSRQTFLYSSSTSNAIQRPSFSIDLEGSQDLVLTRLVKANAKLVIVENEEASYLIFQQSSGTFVAEVHSIPKTRIEVAVPSRRLLVYRRSGGDLQVAELEMVWGGSHRLVPSDFVNRPYDQLVRRGGEFSLYPHKLALRYGVEGDHLRGLWIMRHGPALGYEYEIDTWSLKSELGISFSSYQHGLFTNKETALSALFGLQWSYPLKAILLNLGFGPSLQWIYQRRHRLDADRLAKAGIDGDPVSTEWTLSPGIHGEVGWTASISKNFYVGNSLRGSLFALRLKNADQKRWYADWSVEVALGMGYRF